MWAGVLCVGSCLGHLLLFHANLTTSTPAATFVNRETQGTGHRAVVRYPQASDQHHSRLPICSLRLPVLCGCRCALSIPTSGSEAARLLTAGEDGLVCQWAQVQQAPIVELDARVILVSVLRCRIRSRAVRHGSSCTITRCRDRGRARGGRGADSDGQRPTSLVLSG